MGSLAIAICVLGVLSCLFSLLGGLFFTGSLINYLGPLSLIAMLPAVVFGNLAVRIAFWLLAGTFVTWQWASLPWPRDWPYIPWFVIPQTSMLFLFVLLVWRAVRREPEKSPPEA